MNCGPPPPDQLLSACLPKLNWEQPTDPLSSIISLPPLPPGPVAAAISGEISGFVSNPLNSMPANRLMNFPTDPGFTERAARNSCFSAGNYGALAGQFSRPDAGKLSRVSSTQSLKSKEFHEIGDAELGSGREDSSVTDPISSPVESNGKKRKTLPKGKAKVEVEKDLNGKKCRLAETTDDKEDQNGEKKEKDNGSKVPEPPKDYIHVRARRGQATDSHSLAERVRREKISQRMKLLQDLVPGCNKITGKALMLDEIINYVQSLQRQVEFLSMKLATVNPRGEFNLGNLVTKESLMNQENTSLPDSVYSFENLAAAFPFSHRSPMSQIESTLDQMQPTSHDLFGTAASSQHEHFWDDELHSIIQMGFSQNQENGVISHYFHGQLPSSNMKIEL